MPYPPPSPYRPLLLALLVASTLGGTPSEASEPSPAERFREAELAAARKIDLYLVLARDGRSLDVRARGMVLDTIPIERSTVLSYRELRSGGGFSAALPAQWTVQREPAAEHRHLIAPEELQPYSEEAAAQVAATPPGLMPEPPSSYEVGLDAGWALRVSQETPSASLWSRLAQAIGDGWRRLRRRDLERPPTLVLTVGELEGRRLHQLFREGRKILVDPEARTESEAAS